MAKARNKERTIKGKRKQKKKLVSISCGVTDPPAHRTHRAMSTESGHLLPQVRCRRWGQQRLPFTTFDRIEAPETVRTRQRGPRSGVALLRGDARATTLGFAQHRGARTLTGETNVAVAGCRCGVIRRRWPDQFRCVSLQISGAVRKRTRAFADSGIETYLRRRPSPNLSRRRVAPSSESGSTRKV